MNNYDKHRVLTIELPDDIDGAAIEWLDVLSIRCRWWPSDRTVDIEAVAPDGTVLGQMTVAAPEPKDPEAS